MKAASCSVLVFVGSMLSSAILAQPAPPPIGAGGPLTPAPLAAEITAWITYPGEFAFKTRRGFYLTAINGGGRAAEPVVVTATNHAGPWEKFRIAAMSPAPSHDKSIQTASGNYLTAVNGGGMTADVLHTDATQVRQWEQFRVIDLGAGGVAPTYFALQTIKGRYLTALGEGGRYDAAVHSDAAQVKAWERLRIVKCGDLGSGYQYTIITPDNLSLTAPQGGGQTGGAALVRGWWPGDTPDRAWAKFRLLRQPDGSYALQTANGRNFLTALGGGGQVQRYLKCDPGFPGACLDGASAIFHTDATQVRAWEQFRLVDVGTCKYSIQTSSGFFFGIYKDSGGRLFMTTRRSEVSDNEKFELVMHGLASPPVFK